MCKLKLFTTSLVNLTLMRRCAILEMKNTENRFNTEFINHLNNALDEVEQSKDVDALVTVGAGKFFSNGIDIAFVKDSNSENFSTFINEYSKLMARFLTFPMPTVAAINGHAFAAGGLLAMAHDYRFMRKDRGWMCLNEVRLQLRFPPGICTMLALKVNHKQTLMNFLVYGKRYTGPEAVANQLVDGVYGSDELIDHSVKFLEDLVSKDQFDRPTVRTMKMDLFRNAVGDLTKDFTVDDLELFPPTSRF